MAKGGARLASVFEGLALIADRQHSFPSDSSIPSEFPNPLAWTRCASGLQLLVGCGRLWGRTLLLRTYQKAAGLEYWQLVCEPTEGKGNRRLACRITVYGQGVDRVEHSWRGCAGIRIARAQADSLTSDREWQSQRALRGHLTSDDGIPGGHGTCPKNWRLQSAPPRSPSPDGERLIAPSPTS